MYLVFGGLGIEGVLAMVSPTELCLQLVHKCPGSGGLALLHRCPIAATLAGGSMP